MACLNFQNIYFREHLSMAAFIRSRSTCFSEHLKVDAFFTKQLCYFFLGMFLVKESRRKTRTFIPTFMMRGNSIIAFHHVFIVNFYAVTFQKLLFTDKTGARKIAPWRLAPGRLPPTITLTITLILAQGENLWRDSLPGGAIFRLQTKHKDFDSFKATHFQH